MKIFWTVTSFSLLALNASAQQVGTFDTSIEIKPGQESACKFQLENLMSQLGVVPSLIASNNGRLVQGYLSPEAIQAAGQLDCVSSVR